MVDIGSVLKDSEIFVEGLHDDYKCGICCGVLNSAMQCQQGHVFCRDCITEWLSQKQSCPTCRIPLEAHTLAFNRTVDNLIGKSQVRCVHGPDHRSIAGMDTTGCGWIGYRRDIIAHLMDECMLQPLECLNKDLGCDVMLLRSEFADGHHVCPAVCKWCMEVFRVSEMEQHSAECHMAIVSCENDGCGEEMQRRDIAAHESECLFAMLDCPFAIHGCKVNGTGRIRRGDMDRHQAEAAIPHSIQLAQQLARTNELLSKVRSNVEGVPQQARAATAHSPQLAEQPANTGNVEGVPQQARAATAHSPQLAEQPANTGNVEGVPQQARAATAHSPQLAEQPANTGNVEGVRQQARAATAQSPQPDKKPAQTDAPRAKKDNSWGRWITDLFGSG